MVVISDEPCLLFSPPLVISFYLHRRFNNNPIAQLWYFVKCIYFGLSAYQIKCGYPNRILGNFLTKHYNYLNLFLFQGYERFQSFNRDDIVIILMIANQKMFGAAYFWGSQL